MEVHLLAIQARILLWMALAVAAAGIWIGLSPLTVAWRAALAGVLAMWACRWLLGQVAQVVEERMAQDLADAQLAEEQAQADKAKREMQQTMAQAQSAAKLRTAGKPTPVGTR